MSTFNSRIAISTILVTSLFFVSQASTQTSGTIEVSATAPVLENERSSRESVIEEKSTPLSGQPLGMRFEINQGQSDPQVRFVSRGRGFNLFLTSTEAVLLLNRGAAARRETDPIVDQEPFTLRMKMASGESQLRVSGLQELSETANYFIGNSPAAWRTKVPAYAKVQYEDVHPGIDLVFYGNEEHLEYDYTVAPGSDPGAIAFRLEGAEELEIDENGDLVIGNPGDGIRFQKPVIYQEDGATREEIRGGYVLKSRDEICFFVAEYDAARPLIIDPVFVYSSFLGGSGVENAGSGSDVKRADIAADAEGNTYLIGTTDSMDFPTVNGVQTAGTGLEAFIVKLNPTGSVIYSTYLGGRRLERGYGIDVDTSGNVYVTGRTQSDDFPTVNAMRATLRGVEDAFVAKLQADGSRLIYSTFLGGSNSDSGIGIAVDSAGAASVAGETQSRDFPIINAFQGSFGGGVFDSWVAKLNAAGSALVFGTYLGGSGEDDAEDIVLDSSGGVYVAGVTNSGNFPTANALQPSMAGIADAFVTKLTATGSLAYSTYLGGTDFDYGTAIDVDGDGQAFLIGGTNSPDFPAAAGRNNGRLDAFIAKLNSTGSSVLYSRYVGGSGEDIPYGVGVDLAGNAYIGGTTSSNDFPTANPVQALMRGVRDAFVVKLNPSGAGYAYSTYLGGSGLDYIFGLAVDPSNSMHLTGITTSADFPTALPFQSEKRGVNSDAFVLKIASSVPAFSISDRASMSWSALGGPDSATVGYARIQPTPGGTTPAGLAIFTFRQNGIVVSEASVPASPLIQSGRIYAEVKGPVNTGLAIANPSVEPATISFYFTDENGRDFGQGSTIVSSQGQIARFLNEPPFNGGVALNGTFTFSSSRPVSVIALRGFINERAEFLITTLPVSELSAVSESITLPHFADGGGWKTQLALINPTDEPLSGSVEFFAAASSTTPGQPVEITVDGQTGVRFPWSIAPRSSKIMRTSGSSSQTNVGWALITPATNSKTPAGLAIFSFNNRGVTVSEAGVPSIRPASTFRMYAEASGTFSSGAAGSIQTGVAVSNPAGNPVTLTFDLTNQAGASVGQGTAVVPARGHVAMFLSQINGFESLRLPLQGVLRVSSNPTSAISVVGLRGRYNERGDFLITTITPVNEGAAVSFAESLFPHFVSGGGYTTQFMLFSGSAGQMSTGTLPFFSQAGQTIQ